MIRDIGLSERYTIPQWAPKGFVYFGFKEQPFKVDLHLDNIHYPPPPGPCPNPPPLPPKPHPPQTGAPKPQIIFVIGKPGLGKSTQCLKLSREQDIVRIPLHNLLRKEIERQKRKYGSMIMERAGPGREVLKDMCIDLLRYALVSGVYGEGKRVFVVEGFPENMEEAYLFEQKICRPKLALNIQCGEEDTVPRLVNRGSVEGSKYDSAKSILDKLEVYKRYTSPVIYHYRGQGLVKDVNGVGSVEVYTEIKAVLEKGLIAEGKR
ncbi:adenylate kinase-domain-containing protein [Aspergillus undulatus]|uniref:adenylate kinase-domain-containing protein n=1 Tax=Aspergillus undulatus TaxID=1810928 RepID=UPI003CCC9C32